MRHQVKGIKQGRRSWATNDLDLTPPQIKPHYRRHQHIEETFRLLKQEFGWGACRARTFEVQLAHLHLGLMALGLHTACRL